MMPPSGGAEAEHAEQERTDVEHLLREQHQRRSRHHAGEVHEAEDDRHRSQQRVPPQPAHALGELGPRTRRGAALVAGARRGTCRGSAPTRAAATKNEAASTKNGHGERGDEEQRTERRSDERVGHALGAPQPAVGLLEVRPGATMFGISVWAELSRSTSAMPSSSVARSTTRYSPVRVPVTDSTSSGAGERALLAEHGERDAEGEQRRAACPSSTIARRRSTRSVMTPAGSVNTSHGRRCATHDERDEHRVAGDRRGEPRVGDRADAVAEVRDDAGAEQLVEVAAEPPRRWRDADAVAGRVGSRCRSRSGSVDGGAAVRAGRTGEAVGGEHGEVEPVLDVAAARAPR